MTLSKLPANLRDIIHAFISKESSIRITFLRDADRNNSIAHSIVKTYFGVIDIFILGRIYLYRPHAILVF